MRSVQRIERSTNICREKSSADIRERFATAVVLGFVESFWGSPFFSVIHEEELRQQAQRTSPYERAALHTVGDRGSGTRAGLEDAALRAEQRPQARNLAGEDQPDPFSSGRWFRRWMASERINRPLRRAPVERSQILELFFLAPIQLDDLPGPRHHDSTETLESLLAVYP